MRRFSQPKTILRKKFWRIISLYKKMKYIGLHIELNFCKNWQKLLRPEILTK